jgi:molecular chaperone GrpE
MFGRKNNEDESVKEESEAVEEQEVKEVEVQESQVDEAAQEQLARLSADFQNYKKRVEKDRTLWIDRSRMDVLLPMLSVVDNFDRALNDAKKNDEQEAFKNWVQGFEMIRKALYDFLAQQKVVVIEQMQTFDPMLHEAVMQVESADHQSDDIVEILQAGFMYKDKVLRTAKVTVAK